MTIPSVDYSADFAAFWREHFPGAPCKPVPRSPEDLSLTERMALSSYKNGILAQNLFGASGRGSAPLPADTQARLSQGQLKPEDAPHLRRAGLEHYAQQCEAIGQRAMDQRLVDYVVAEAKANEAERQRNAAWNNASYMDRLAMSGGPSPQAVASAKAAWGISE